MTACEAIGRVVLKALTTRLECSACGAGFTVLRGSEDAVGECERCNNTSYRSKAGRPWGHRHRNWDDWVRSEWSLDDDNRFTKGTADLFGDHEDLAEWMVIAEAQR